MGRRGKTNKPGTEVPGLARQKGLEPLTYWFVASYSIQLSYCRMSFRFRVSLSLTTSLY